MNKTTFRRMVTLLVMVLSFQAFSQAPTKGNAGKWLSFDHQEVRSSDFFNTHQEKWGLSARHSFELIKTEKDELGMVHFRYRQQFDGVPIEAATMLLHERNGLLTSANGFVVEGDPVGVKAISFEAALKAAMSTIETERFYWDDPEMEKLVKHLKGDENATYYPEEQLVWVDPSYSGLAENYSLTYKFDLYFHGIHDHAVLYIDAKTGKLIHELDGCHTGSGNAKGTAVTKYHGTQSITTDSIAPDEFRLVDLTRGGGVETYNAQENSWGWQTPSPVHFIDSNNYWNNFNADKDEVATDVHWSSEMFYDYYSTKHNRLSFDGQDGKIMSWVHYDVNWFNASWNGQYARYGDGNGSPLTSIDVVAHELTHGVTGNSADLVYAYESGALNESFSDIFGTAVEFWAMGAANSDWKMGKANFVLRSISNPKSYGDPDTYKGTNWVFTSQDNGGVHTNSGVQNYWFYLLSEGGTGTNDNGDSYTVTGLTMDKAAKIAYRNLNYYLVENSQYIDARRGAILAAKDIYGACSVEMGEVAKAWHAVGVGPDTTIRDLEIVAVHEPIGGCELKNNQTVVLSYTLMPAGCDSVIPIGDSITFDFDLNGTMVSETMVLTSPIYVGDTNMYTFLTTVDLSTVGNYTLNTSINYHDDLYAENNSIGPLSIDHIQQVFSDDSLTFEIGNRPHEDPIYSGVSGAFAHAGLSVAAANSGVLGFELTGSELNTDEIIIPDFPSDNFTINESYGSSLCMCIDATNWDHVTLEFDLKQTYSRIYQYFMQAGNINELVSSMRITVDGNQIGGQYHPDTYMVDPFKRHFVNLDQYAGTKFQVCFEGRHFIDDVNDPTNTLGDYTFLDNINIKDYQFISIDEYQLGELTLYPNPSKGKTRLNLESVTNGDLTCYVTDAVGRKIYQQGFTLNKGSNEWDIDLTGAAPGIYFIHLESGGKHNTHKWTIQ